MIIFLCADRAVPFSGAAIFAGVVVGLLIATMGYTYPVIRYVQRLAAQDQDALPLGPTLLRMLLAAGLSGVALLGTWGAAQWIPTWADKLTGEAGCTLKSTRK